MKKAFLPALIYLTIYSFSSLGFQGSSLLRSPIAVSLTSLLAETATFSSTPTSGYTSLMIVPTGIGATIGGYAGDALPSCRLLSTVTDTLITHPNVMNGASLYWPASAMSSACNCRGFGLQYVEGYMLDEFAAGRVSLSPKRKKGQKIGLLLDRGMEDELRQRHLQVANAARATLGLDVAECVITSRSVGVQVNMSPAGASWGSLSDVGEQTLVEGARKLMDLGCTAIAVVCRFPEDEQNAEQGLSTAEFFKAYQRGEGIDVIAGVEALISRVISKNLCVPCAHAPAFSPWELDNAVSPKACAEELGYTFLPCVLSYLHHAPDIHKLSPLEIKAFPSISASDVDSVIVPLNALGGPATLSLMSKGALIVVVEENETSMKMSTEAFIKENSKCNIMKAKSYAEAAGIVAAHREGINFESITGKVSPISVHKL